MGLLGRYEVKWVYLEGKYTKMGEFAYNPEGIHVQARLVHFGQGGELII